MQVTTVTKYVQNAIEIVQLQYKTEIFDTIFLLVLSARFTVLATA